MFCNILKSISKPSLIRGVKYTNRNLSLCPTQRNIDYGVKEKFRSNAEVDAAEEIESGLFDNSRRQHNPVSVGEVLNAHKKARKIPSTVKNSFHEQQKNKPQIKTRSRTEPQKIVDKDLGLEFYRLHSQDSTLQLLMSKVRSRKRRDKNREIIIEGRRLIKEALQCHFQLKSVFFSLKENLIPLKDELLNAQKKVHTKIYKIAQHDLNIWSTLSTPPGLLALFERPTNEGAMLPKRDELKPITVVCDNIREPNNLGSIIRTCAAIPCTQVFVTRGCCDPWDSKALRGGCGGQFRVRIHDDIDWDLLPKLLNTEVGEDYNVFIAENNINKLQNKKLAIDYAEPGHIGVHNVVVIGGETHGVSDSAKSFLSSVGDKGKYLHIPLANGIDSLNVASALTLILYELRKYV